MVKLIRWPEGDMPTGGGYDYEANQWVAELCWLDVETGDMQWHEASWLPPVAKGETTQ